MKKAILALFVAITFTSALGYGLKVSVSDTPSLKAMFLSDTLNLGLWDGENGEGVDESSESSDDLFNNNKVLSTVGSQRLWQDDNEEWNVDDSSCTSDDGNNEAYFPDNWDVNALDVDCDSSDDNDYYNSSYDDYPSDDENNNDDNNNDDDDDDDDDPAYNPFYNGGFFSNNWNVDILDEDDEDSDWNNEEWTIIATGSWSNNEEMTFDALNNQGWSVGGSWNNDEWAVSAWNGEDNDESSDDADFRTLSRFYAAPFDYRNFMNGWMNKDTQQQNTNNQWANNGNQQEDSTRNQPVFASLSNDGTDNDNDNDGSLNEDQNDNNGWNNNGNGDDNSNRVPTAAINNWMGKDKQWQDMGTQWSSMGMQWAGGNNFGGGMINLNQNQNPMNKWIGANGQWQNAGNQWMNAGNQWANFGNNEQNGGKKKTFADFIWE